MSGDPVRVGFIGCGTAADNHRRALPHCEQARFIAVASRDIGRVKAKAGERGAEEIMESPERVIASDSQDAVLLGSDHRR